MLLLILRLESLYIMPSLVSSVMTRWLKWPRPMREPAMNTNSINRLTWALCHTTRTLSFKPMLCPSHYRNRRPVASVCPAYGQTCHQCGKNHWSQICRAQRNSSAGWTLSSHKQQRQRRPLGNKHNKQFNMGGKGSGAGPKKGTPKKKQGGDHNKRTFKATLLEVVMGGDSISDCVGLSGPAHPPKEKYSVRAITPSQTEACSNPFECYTLNNGNGELNDTESDGKTDHH